MAIHTIAMAGFQILRDLVRQKGIPLERRLDAVIPHDQQPKLWRETRAFYTFLKHANKDPDAAICYDSEHETINDSVLLLACGYYDALGHQLTPKMCALVAWHSVLHPEFLPGDADPKLRAEADFIPTQPRRVQLTYGLELITRFELVENHPY